MNENNIFHYNLISISFFISHFLFFQFLTFSFSYILILLFHFLQVVMRKVMKKMMKKVKKKFSRKLLNNDSNLKVHADYNINCEIVSLISALAKILHEIKCY